MAEQARSSRRRKKRSIVELMRGDIIRLVASSQINKNIYFIDYIDETNIRLIADMRTAASDAASTFQNPTPVLNLELINGRFPSELQLESIELLYRNENEQGYARQRGLVPGKWVEIEYITEKDEVTLTVCGEIISLPDDTDCIGLSVYQEGAESPIIYIDFEFKGLSEDHLHIRSIKVCNKPRSLVKEQEELSKQKHREKIDQVRQEEQEAQEEIDAQEDGDGDEGNEEHDAKVNLEFQKSPPGPVDGSPAQKVLIDEGDRIAITFESTGDDDASPVVFIKEISRYYSLEEQQHELLEALIEMAPTSKSHHLASTKEYGRMIERYTQLRETYSVQTAHGNLVRRPYYGDGYKPMVHALLLDGLEKDGMDFNFTNDWLMPIYVQKRIIYCVDEKEETLFENSSDAEVINAVDRLIKDRAEYEQYDTGKSYFSAYLNNIRMNTTPYSISDDIQTFYKPLFKSASLQCFSTSASNVKSMLVPAFDKSKTWNTCFNMCRYIGGDSVPEYPAGFMVRPYPFVSYSSLKSAGSSIMDKTNARLVVESSDPLGTSSYHWWSLGSGSFGDNGSGGSSGSDEQRTERACASMFKKHSVDLRHGESEKDLVPFHERFANTMQTEMYFSKKFNRAALYNMVPFTEELANKVMSYYKNYYTALTPDILIKSLSPFFIQPEHITQQTFSIFSAVIRENVKVFKSTMKFMKRKYEAYESFTYPGFDIGNGPTLNALYAMLTDPKTAKSGKVIEASSKSKSKKEKEGSSSHSVFDTTVVSKYPIKEWMVKGRDQQKILSTSEVLSRMFFVDFGRCLMNEVIQMNMTSDNLYGVNVTGVIDHFVSEAEKAAGIVNAVKDKDATDVKTGNKEPKNGKFILAKRYENMGDLNADNDAVPHVHIAYDVAYDSTDYEFIRKYEKERRKMPEDVFKAFLIDKFQHMQQTKRKQKMTVVECAFEVDSMISGRRLVRAGSKDRAVVEFSGPVSSPGEATGEDSVVNMDAYDPKPNPNLEEGAGEGGVSKEYRYYKLRSNGTWELDDTIPKSITPENMEFFGNIVPGAIVMKNNCLSTDTGITAESSAVVTSLAKASLISKITHEFDGIIETKQDEFQKVFSEKLEYYYYRLGAEMVIQIKKQMDAMNKQYRLGQDAKARHDAAASTSIANMAISPHRDILNAYLGNGSFPRMQELIISFAQNYTRKANRPCIGTPAPTEHSTESTEVESRSESAIEPESCEWLYCKDSGAKLMPAWLLEKATAYVNDSIGELSYINVMDRICRDYGVVEGAVWVDGKKCKSGLVIMPLAFSTYEGIDEQGFKIKSHSVISMDDDDDILLGGAAAGGRRRDDDDSRLQEQAYIQRINSKFENSSAHKINDIVTPVLKLGLGIAPDRNGLRQRIITSVIHTITKLNDSLFQSEKLYLAENSQKKTFPSYESYRDRVTVMTTLAHIIVVIQSAIPDIRPSKTFQTCKRTFQGFPLDGDGGGDKCIEYIACIATGVKDASKDVWIPVLSFKVDRYIKDIKAILTQIFKDETDGHLDKMLTDKRSYLQQEMMRESQRLEQQQQRQNVEDRVQKWTQFLPLPYSLKVKAPSPVTREMQESFLKALKNGSHSQHEQMDVLHSKIMHYSLYIQNLIQDWIKTGGGGKLSLILFTDDRRPATENACCDDMDMVLVNPASSGANANPENTKSAATVLEYFIMHANGNIREFNWQIERLGKELAMVNRSSKSYILSIDPRLVKHSMLELSESANDPFSKSAVAAASYPYSEETIIRGFIHFFKLDYPNAYIHPKLESLRGRVPENYDPRAEFADKMAKLKTSNMEDQFGEVLETVNRVSMLDAPSTLGGDGKNLFELKSFVKRNQMFPSSAIADHVRHFVNLGISPETIFKLMKKYSIHDGAVMTDVSTSDIFDSIKELDIYDPFKYTLTELIPELNIFSEDIRSGLYEIVDSVEMEEISRLQDSILEMLSNACQASRTAIRASVVQDKRSTVSERRTGKDKRNAASSPEQVMEFIELLDRYEGDEMYENKRTLHHSRDESGPAILKFIAFIKNAVRFMLQTVPGLLITSEIGNDKDKYVSSKHWKFGDAHNTDISTCIDVQYTGLSMFRDDPEIMRHMRTMDTGSVHKNAGYMILQLVNTIPFALDGRNKLSVDLVKKLYTYLFYKTIELYVGDESSGSGSVFMARERQVEGEREGEAADLSFMGGIGNIDSDVLRDDFVFLSDGIAPRAKRRELLIAVMGNVIKMKSHNSVSTVEMREIMAGIRRKETEDMRYAFYMTSASTKTDAFLIKKTMLKLRIGEYSVGAQVGYRKYDRDFDERERDARNTRLAEGGGDPNLSVEAFEDDIHKQTESNVMVDGQQAIAPMDGDDFDRDQLMRNEIEIVNAC
jgi:hypothetical protein